MNLTTNKKKTMDLTKLIDIEIPVANKANVIHTHLIPSIRNLEPVKEFVRLVLNLNGPISKRELLLICGTCRRHGIKFIYKNFSYNFPKGKADNLIIRRDTHSIVEDHAPFFLFTDDDVLISKDWCKDLMISLFYMLSCPSIGMVSIAYLTKKDAGLIYPIKPSNSIWTGGGVLFRNIEEWGDIVPK